MARIATIDKRADLAPNTSRSMMPSRRAGVSWVVRGWRCCIVPELAQRTAHLGSYVRFESSLDHKLIEFTALVAARELECKHEWAAHVAHGQKAGIPTATIRAVYEKKSTESFSLEDAQIVSFVREMLHSHRVTEPTYQAVYGRLGEQGMVELTATIGYYAMLACTLNTFDVATATEPDEFKIK